MLTEYVWSIHYYFYNFKKQLTTFLKGKNSQTLFAKN